MTRFRIALATALATAAAVAPLLLAALPAAAQGNAGRPTLRASFGASAPVVKADIMATRDILTLGDLVSGLPRDVAEQPAFRAPSLGETGTIQSMRIVEAVRAQGVETVHDGGTAQVVVTRAARRLTMVDIEAALRRSIEERYGVDARSFNLALDNGAPSLVVEPELRGLLQTQDLVYDVRTRRVTATLTMPGSASMRLKPVRVTGQMVDTVEVVVPIRAINRGDILQAGDIMVERRPRDGALTDLAIDMQAVIGKSARRAMAAGQLVRNADLQRQEIVARNETVTVVYEAPGLMLTMRARAQEAGAQGDVISVLNVQSKKVLQGTVSGPGRVVVNGAASARVASAN